VSAQTPASYGMSALVHGGAVGLIMFFSYAASSMVEDTPKILELVAGQGENYAATAAPALGSAGGVKLQTPAPVLPDPAPATAQPSPIQEAPETPPAHANPRAAKPKVAKPVDILASLKHAELRREKNLEAKYKKEEAAEAKREAAMRRVSHIDAEGIREGVVGGSAENKAGGAGGKALTREEGTELEAYFAELLMKIKESHTPPEGVSNNLSAHVELFVAADGSISHVRITGSSGNAEFDASVIEACEHTRSIGPRPDGRSETVSFTFKMKEDETP
jgi:colicin import membrane protein